MALLIAHSGVQLRRIEGATENSPHCFSKRRWLCSSECLSLETQRTFQSRRNSIGAFRIRGDKSSCRVFASANGSGPKDSTQTLEQQQQQQEQQQQKQQEEQQQQTRNAGPPVATIVAGLVVLLVVVWCLGSLVAWLLSILLT